MIYNICKINIHNSHILYTYPKNGLCSVKFRLWWLRSEDVSWRTFCQRPLSFSKQSNWSLSISAKCNHLSVSHRNAVSQITKCQAVLCSIEGRSGFFPTCKSILLYCLPSYGIQNALESKTCPLCSPVGSLFWCERWEKSSFSLNIPCISPPFKELNPQVKGMGPNVNIIMNINGLAEGTGASRAIAAGQLPDISIQNISIQKFCKENEIFREPVGK